MYPDTFIPPTPGVVVTVQLLLSVPVAERVPSTYIFVWFVPVPSLTTAMCFQVDNGITPAAVLKTSPVPNLFNITSPLKDAAPPIKNPTEFVVLPESKTTAFCDA